MISIGQLWKRINSQKGETFTQIRGGEFSYSVNGDYISLDRTNQNISKAHFAEALILVPLQNTVPVQHLRGPSYIYAILMDKRIRQSDW